MYAAWNLGTCGIMIYSYILMCIIWAILNCLKEKCKCKCAVSCHTKLSKSLFWGFILRLFFEGYLELCLSVFVSLTDMEWKNQNGSVIFNNLFSIVLTCLLSCLPIFIVVFYIINLRKLTDEQFKEKFGDIYDGLVLD